MFVRLPQFGQHEIFYACHRCKKPLKYPDGVVKYDSAKALSETGVEATIVCSTCLAALNKEKPSSFTIDLKEALKAAFESYTLKE